MTISAELAPDEGVAAATLAFDDAPPLPRYQNPAADAIIGRKIRMLDRGYVYLVDYMGGDSAIVQAARTSYGAGTKRRSEDNALIRRLMRDRHHSPFEMVDIKVHLKAPIFVLRQLVRHRTHALNEISGRYSVLSDEMYLPEPEDVAYQDARNKQGRGETFDEEEAIGITSAIREQHRADYALYRRLVDELGVARELARIVLPLSLYSELYWKQNLRNYLHLLSLRLDPHAQWEIRQLAEGLALIARTIAPVTYAAWEEYEFHAVRLGRAAAGIAREALAALEQSDPEALAALLARLPSENERVEFRRQFALGTI